MKGVGGREEKRGGGGREERTERKEHLTPYTSAEIFLCGNQCNMNYTNSHPVQGELSPIDQSTVQTK